LSAYTWNLVESYAEDFVLTAHEIMPDWRMRVARFESRRRFVREALAERTVSDGVLLAEPQFRLRAQFLDHRTPCLAFAFEECVHVNVWKNGLAELGLPTGPWLKELKGALLENAPDDRPIRASWRDRHGIHERVLALGELRAKSRLTRAEDLLSMAYTPENGQRICKLAAGADLLFIEHFPRSGCRARPEPQSSDARQAGCWAAKRAFPRLSLSISHRATRAARRSSSGGRLSVQRSTLMTSDVP
jgi:ribonuclease Z